MRARPVPLALAALVALAGALPAAAAPTIDVRVSFKIVRKPSDGSRPPTTDGHLITDQELQSMLQVANDSLLASYGRGYRFVLAEPPVEVGTTCSTCPSSNPSFWYYQTYDGTMTLHDLDVTAKTYPTAYAWRTNAINIYINQGKGNGGVASFPPDAVVAFGATVVDPAFRAAFPGALVHHELGHYFTLKHTFDSQPGCVDNTAAGCSACGGGDDDVDDTLMDRACASGTGYPLPGWEWLDIAQKNYGINWADTPAQHAAVDDVYYNNMSYHNGGLPYGRMVLYNLTEGQLDRWTDAADDVRRAACSGRTWFVSSAGSLFGAGSSTSPFQYVTQGINAAASGGGDIVLMRPGTYLLSSTLNKPLTLRATRKGPAVITR